MAIDTREKRASTISMVHHAPNTVTPLATPDQEWRQESGWAYSGILVGGAPAPTGVVETYEMPKQMFSILVEAAK